MTLCTCARLVLRYRAQTCCMCMAGGVAISDYGGAQYCYHHLNYALLSNLPLKLLEYSLTKACHQISSVLIYANQQ